jgi:alpha-ketoglutarate-dependent taurine dioxygenase
MKTDLPYKIAHIEPFGVRLEPAVPMQSVNTLSPTHLVTLIKEHGLVVLRGFQTFQNSQEFALFGERFGTISLWPFGKVLELEEHSDPKDHIFDRSCVPLHWDGMYRAEIPELQIFHCVQAPAQSQGGRTTFSHTIKALKNASEENIILWRKVTGIYERKMKYYHSKVTKSVVELHPYRNDWVIRYNEPPPTQGKDFINPALMHFEGINGEDMCSFLETIQSALHDPRNFYAHTWAPQDVVLSDNFTLLHGREEFAPQSFRHLQRVQVLSHPVVKNKGLEEISKP